MRGEPSIINKWDKAKIALEYGADLIIELPFNLLVNPDIFAKGGISIKTFKVKYLVFE